VSNDDEYNQLIEQISFNIRKYRKKRGFSQVDMEQFGFDVKNYQKIEYGKHHYSLHTVFKLSRAFKCSIDDLINEPKPGRKS
jgi:transcriptional regulator with XRE-family HTH domain